MHAVRRAIERKNNAMFSTPELKQLAIVGDLLSQGNRSDMLHSLTKGHQDQHGEIRRIVDEIE